MLGLDGALFEDRGWFAIDRSNRRVRGVDVATLEAGLALIGQGQVATVVGRLRSHVRVVDIDVEGARGHAMAETVAAWATSRGVWTLVRPSGGADGRSHVFITPGGHLDDLGQELARIRAAFAVSAKAVDLRRVVRPLSAPHRTGRMTRPHGSVRTLAASLPTPIQEDRPARPRQAAPRPGTPITPRPRRRRELPTPWAAYLEDGTPPPIGGHDHSRSTVEAIATGHLLRSGYTAEQAWQTILAAHPAAMSKARQRGRHWWVRHVWNRAATADRDYTPASRTDPAVAASVQAARARLEDLQWTVPPRRRATLLLVGHHLLDRMARVGALRVPCPERDLALDTSLTDRKAIRAALRALHGPLGTLHTDALDPRAAHKGESSFEFEIPQIEARVSQSPPPSSHTPVPAGTWATLPRACHALWRQLLQTDEPSTVQDLAPRAGLTTTRQATLTPRQGRTAREALTALARAGLAHCDAHGRWTATQEVTDTCRQVAETAHQVQSQQVATERAAYRQGQYSRWNREQAAALKANKAREQAWWDGLPPAERAARRVAWAQRFRWLSVEQQERRKAVLVERRLRAGVDEPARYRAWVDAQSEAVYTRRAAERTAWFATLPGPLQQAYVAAWQRHRAHYGIPRDIPIARVRREHATLLPDTNGERDTAHLEAQVAPLLPLEALGSA